VAEVTSAPTRTTGIVLAGGLARRMGGPSKPGVVVHGKAMVQWPLEALGAVCDRVAVVCKADTPLPELAAGVERWDEPAEPRHPLTGIVHALEQAGGPVLVCAADMPFVTPDTLRAVEAGRGDAVACVGRAGGHLQPLLAWYSPGCLDVLRGAGEDAPLTGTVRLLQPAVVDVPERDAISIDTPEGVRRAERLLSGFRPRRRRATG
jgi:molybdopterin-guanine dinucleotide biosynthesis protein A